MKKRKYIMLGIFGVIAAGTIVTWARLYPVALVNGSPIWYRTWDRYLQGTIHAIIVQARASQSPFNPDAAVMSAIRKSTLTTLIEDKIITDYAAAIIPELNAKTEKRIQDALHSSSDIDKAAQLMYGFDARNFHDAILLPQAKREMTQEEFAAEHIHFDAWLAGAKKKTRVRIFLNGYAWDGDTVR